MHSNYGPIFSQLQNYLNTNFISGIFQPGFKALDSTKSALLKVFNDTFMSTDAASTMALVLLD